MANPGPLPDGKIKAVKRMRPDLERNEISFKFFVNGFDIMSINS